MILPGGGEGEEGRRGTWGDKGGEGEIGGSCNGESLIWG